MKEYILTPYLTLSQANEIEKEFKTMIYSVPAPKPTHRKGRQIYSDAIRLNDADAIIFKLKYGHELSLTYV